MSPLARIFALALAFRQILEDVQVHQVSTSLSPFGISLFVWPVARLTSIWFTCGIKAA
jgi:hypothetical protein